MQVGVAADVKDLFEICSSAFYQLFQRNIISKEELKNSTAPMYHFRSETDIKAPFEDFDEDIDVKLLDLLGNKIRTCVNKDFLDSVRS